MNPGTDSDSYSEGSFPIVVFVDNNVNSSDSASSCPGRMTGLSVHGNNDESGILQFLETLNSGCHPEDSSWCKQTPIIKQNRVNKPTQFICAS